MMLDMAPEDAQQKIGLPTLPNPPAKQMAGPTPWCNWAIPGRVVAGAYPASCNEAETKRILTTLLELGVDTFVCLQAEVSSAEHERRCIQPGMRPYINDAHEILNTSQQTGSPKLTPRKLEYVHLPIIDGSVTTDSAMSKLAEDCMERVRSGKTLYIHCWGGHGRTGTLVAIMLGRLYNLPYTTALRYCQAYHDSRTFPQGARSPQTPVQRAQVRRLLAVQSLVTKSAPVLMTSTAAAGRLAGSPLLRSSMHVPSILSPQQPKHSILADISNSHPVVAQNNSCTTKPRDSIPAPSERYVARCTRLCINMDAAECTCEIELAPRSTAHLSLKGTESCGRQQTSAHAAAAALPREDSVVAVGDSGRDGYQNTEDSAHDCVNVSHGDDVAALQGNTCSEQRAENLSPTEQAHGSLGQTHTSPASLTTDGNAALSSASARPVTEQRVVPVLPLAGHMASGLGAAGSSDSSIPYRHGHTDSGCSFCSVELRAEHQIAAV